MKYLDTYTFNADDILKRYLFCSYRWMMLEWHHFYIFFQLVLIRAALDVNLIFFVSVV